MDPTIHILIVGIFEATASGLLGVVAVTFIAALLIILATRGSRPRKE
ncbi:hypothetical protein J3R73_002029 [Labrys monachus]|uniref:Uncharacterized protein n=1 Tax=Labrys monachus TaxID=217067 RepID=A0ABU0FD38_9HYPH|nr:hypothetical protein [Labrys monachus]